MSDHLDKRAREFANIIVSEGFRPYALSMKRENLDDLELAFDMAHAWAPLPLKLLYAIMRAEGSLHLAFLDPAENVAARTHSVGNALFPKYKKNMSRAAREPYSSPNGLKYSNYAHLGIRGWVASVMDARDWWQRYDFDYSEKHMRSLAEVWGGSSSYGQQIVSYANIYSRKTQEENMAPVQGSAYPDVTATSSPAPSDPVQTAIVQLTEALKVALSDKPASERGRIVSEMATEAAVEIIDELVKLPEPLESLSDVVLRALRPIIARPLAQRIEAGLLAVLP